MRARLISVLFIALTAGFARAQETAVPPTEQAIAVPESGLRGTYTPSADQGSAISGQVLTAEPLSGLEVALLPSDPASEPHVLVCVRGFRLEGGPAEAPQGAERWAFLLGLPSTLAPGSYPLRIRADAGRGHPAGDGSRGFVLLGQVTVRDREFRSEDIWFDASLTRLMTLPDPRREREAAQLREVLLAFDPAAVRHTGTLQIPVRDARRTSLFADRRRYRYVDGGSSRSLHNGVDLAAPEGTPVLASGSGRVVFSGPRLMSGGSVILEHLPGVYTLYYHLLEILVREGDLVAKGAPIGTVGQTGLATGPHLHWELRISGVAVDPETFLSRALIDKSLDSGTLEQSADLD